MAVPLLISSQEAADGTADGLKEVRVLPRRVALYAETDSNEAMLMVPGVAIEDVECHRRP